MKKTLLFLTLIYFISGQLFAQLEISGRIKNSSGDPIPGVNIIVKGTYKGTVSDIDGSYILSNVPADGILVFSYVGMLTEEITIGGQAVIDVAMIDDIQDLEGVIVIGYGTVKKRDLTGSVSSVKSEEIIKAPTFNAIEAIQGRVPGMDIVRESGAAGSGVNIAIRGNRSIGDQEDEDKFEELNEPLVIIDGLQGGSIEDINPNDIESIEVLKDASSTAIFGYQGANGVILITTKKGVQGKTKVSYNGYYGINGLTPYPSGRLREDYIKLRREAFIGRGGIWESPEDDPSLFSADEWQAIENDQWVDWNDLLLNNGIMQSHQVSVTGGSEKTAHMLSGGMYKEEGAVKDDYTRYNARLNLDHTINKWAKTGMLTQVTYSEQNRRRDPFTKANSTTPLGTPYDEFGQIVIYPVAGNSTILSPLTDLRENAAVDNEIKKKVNSIGYIELTPVKGLTFRSNLGANLEFKRRGVFNDSASMTQYNAKINQAYIKSENSTFLNWDNILTYSKVIGDHSFSFTAITSYTQYTYDFVYAGGKKQPLTTQLFYKLDASSLDEIRDIDSEYEKKETMSYAMRLNYNFRDRYLLTITERLDGASMLSRGNKWDHFPSAAIAWRISDEYFMDNISQISNLKLRLSYGVTGNSNIGAYETQSVLLTSNNISFGEVPAPGFSFSDIIANADAGWEKSAMTNLGIDLGLFQNRLSATVDVYKTTTTDILMKRELPYSGGGISTSDHDMFQIWQNIGSTENKGIELALNSVNLHTSNFKWTSILTYSSNRNKVTELVTGRDTLYSGEENTLIVGEPIKNFFTYKKIGIWQIEDSLEIADMITSFQPGDIKMADLNGDSIINDMDRTVVGQVAPKWSCGLQNTFTFKSFDLSIYLFARWGQTIQNELLDRYNPSGDGNGPAFIDYWTPDNPTNDFPRPGDAKLSDIIGYQSLVLVDGSYFKIKNVTLGYTLPEGISNKAHIEKFRIYGTVSNILTVARSHLVKHYDPENGGSRERPMSKQIVFGLNVEF